MMKTVYLAFTLALLPGILAAMEGRMARSKIMNANLKAAELEVQQEVQQWIEQSEHSVASQGMELQAVDLRTSGRLRAVDNQGSCGSCTAFAATHAWQDYFSRRGCSYPRFATQHILNCPISCNGGYPTSVMSWIQTTGQTTESCLAYRGVKNACGTRCDNGGTMSQRLRTGFTCTTSVATMQSWLDAGYPMAVALTLMYKFYDHGSYSVAVNSVYPRASGSSAVVGGHAMEIVGYGTLGGVNYWLMKNSWGPAWGDRGYMKIRRGTNVGGIESNGACRPTATVCPRLAGAGFDLESLDSDVIIQDDPTDDLLPGEFNNTMPHTHGLWAPGGQSPAETSLDLLGEATTFAIHVLMSTPEDEGGFGCLPSLPSREDMNISGAAMEEMDIVNEKHEGLNFVTVYTADQQVTQGVSYHFIFSFSTTNPQCRGVGGTFDATVHQTSDGYLIMQNVFKTNPPPAAKALNMAAVIGGSVAAFVVVAAVVGYIAYRHRRARKTISKLTEVHKDLYQRLSVLEETYPVVRQAALSKILEDTDPTTGQELKVAGEASRGKPVNWYTNRAAESINSPVSDTLPTQV